MDLLFLGEAGVVASFPNGKVAIDPVSTSVPKERIIEECKGLKLILITHEHKEHFDRALVEALFEAYHPYVVGPKHVLDNLSVHSTYKSDVVVGDTFELNGFEVRVMQVFHPQAKYAVSYFVKSGNATLFHAGDTYETDQLYKIRADVGILPIKGMETMDAARVARMSQRLLFGKIFPVYWGDSKNLVEFMMVAKEKGVRPRLGDWVSV